MDSGAYLPRTPFYVDEREAASLSALYRRPVTPGLYIFTRDGMWGPFKDVPACLAHLASAYPDGDA